MTAWIAKIKTSVGWLNRLWAEPKYKGLREVILFVVITLAIHYSYRFWAQDLDFYPIKQTMAPFREFMARMVFDQSTWVDEKVLGIQLKREGNLMWFSNGAGISINGSCSGDKQLLQLALLLLLFPGRWKYKVWFIPLGLILVHATNILRIVLLSLVAVWNPEWIETVHDTALRGMFYCVIFLVWWGFTKVNDKEVKVSVS